MFPSSTSLDEERPNVILNHEEEELKTVFFSAFLATTLRESLALMMLFEDVPKVVTSPNTDVEVLIVVP